MRIATFGPESIGRGLSLDQAFDAVFGADTLRAMHGHSVKIAPWNERGERRVQFSIAVDNVPKEIRRFFCGDRMRITSRQTQAPEPQFSKITVHHRIRMHFLGAEFFKIRPRFVVSVDDDGQAWFGGQVEHHAVLPPPLDRVAEHFMTQQSERELEKYKQIVVERVADLTSLPIT